MMKRQTVGRDFMILKWPIAWKASWQRLGWRQFALCFVLVGLLLTWIATVWEGKNGLVTAVRIVEIIVPVFAGMQAAFVFSPEDERPLEIMLAAPRPILWTVIERMSITLAGYVLIGLAGILWTLYLVPEATLSDLLVHWLPPLVWFTGVGFYLTLITRQGMFGALMVLVIWGTSLISSGGLPEKHLFFAPVLPYLQRGALNISDELYTLNRITLVLAGLLLVGLTLRLVKDEERLLGIKGKKWALKSWRLRVFRLADSPSPAAEETI